MKSIYKILVLVMMSGLCISLVACSSKKDAPVDVTTEMTQTTEATTQATTEPNTEETAPEIVGDDSMSLPPYSYEIEDVTWAEAGIEMHYPKIVNSNMAGMAEEVNAMILADIQNYVEVIRTNSENISELTVEAVYNYANSSGPILSIQYLGMRTQTSAPYPVGFCHTMTIYLPEARIVTLSELFTIDEAFIETYKSGTYVPEREGLDLEASGLKALDLIGEGYTNAMLIELFSREDATYFLADHGLVLSVDVAHVVGDYVEISIPYETLVSSMKMDNPVWTDYIFLTGTDGY